MTARDDSDSTYVGRFAPSPTGPLHFGSLIAAVASYLDARNCGGKWLVRIEDIDRTRCKAEWSTHILRTLEAFGFEWDGAPVMQSQRDAHYRDALGKLRARDLLYACTCSRKEISDSATQGIEGPVYLGTCRGRQLSESGAALRVRTDDEPVAFVDRVQGDFTQRIESEIGDFILLRKDGLFAYQLAVVVDDALQGITDVVRGADLLLSTPRQIYLQTLLGYPLPRYLHVPVAVSERGEKLSKQTLAPGITPTNARDVLLRALGFLGQDTESCRDADGGGEFLAAAARSWRPEAIPPRMGIRNL
jgi:glutamyl-Q tRNA(Asp) synthetase